MSSSRPLDLLYSDDLYPRGNGNRDQCQRETLESII